jgi:hypothetical protein
MDLTDAALLIEASPDFPHAAARACAGCYKAVSGETRRCVFLSTETTGVHQDTDEVIDLALLPFEYERGTGAIVRVDQEADQECAIRDFHEWRCGSELIYNAHLPSHAQRFAETLSWLLSSDHRMGIRGAASEEERR